MNSSRDLNHLLLIINTILGMIRQDLDLRDLISIKKRPFNPFIPCIVILSSSYALYLLNCLTKMKNLDAISEILWILPLMIQYICKAINGEVQREVALEFVDWMKKVVEEKDSNEIISRIAKEMIGKCMKIAKFIFW